MVKWTDPPTAAIMTAASSMPKLVASPCVLPAYQFPHQASLPLACTSTVTQVS